jgi:hypothetical protein
MSEATSTNVTQSLGFKARTYRISRLLTRQELAEIAGACPEDVDLLEGDLPLSPAVKRKLLRALKLTGVRRQKVTIQA